MVADGNMANTNYDAISVEFHGVRSEFRAVYDGTNALEHDLREAGDAKLAEVNASSVALREEFFEEVEHEAEVDDEHMEESFEALARKLAYFEQLVECTQEALEKFANRIGAEWDSVREEYEAAIHTGRMGKVSDPSHMKCEASICKVFYRADEIQCEIEGIRAQGEEVLHTPAAASASVCAL